MSIIQESFSTRATLPGTHPLSAYLCELMATKKTNLCLSADVRSASALLKVAEEVGEDICVLKTHSDIIDDFGERTIKKLKEISRRKRFLLFEDRKFGDIGSTVQAQYTGGPSRIAQWAHIVNAHVFPGEAIITALSKAAETVVTELSRSVSTEVYAGAPVVSDHEFEDYGGNEDNDVPEPPTLRGLLLLAQMSSEGNLMNKAYTEQAVAWARKHSDFVMGFVGQENLNSRKGDNFLCMTPGVSLPTEGAEEVKGDGLGQQYRTPARVIREEGVDIVIVGRGILKAADRAKEAKRYREEAWKAYLARIKA